MFHLVPRLGAGHGAQVADGSAASQREEYLQHRMLSVLHSKT